MNRPLLLLTGLAVALLTAAPASSRCSGTPPPARAPVFVYDSKACKVVEYTIPVVRPAPATKPIPLQKPISNECPNCNSEGLVCSVQLGAADTKAIEATINQEISVGVSTTGVSFSYSTSFSTEATAGCQVNAPKCAVTIVSQELFAEATYSATAKERFEYESCTFYRDDFFGATVLGLTTGQAISCGYEEEKVEGKALVRAKCGAPQHNKWKCPDAKCKECCPDEKGSQVPSADPRRPALVVPPSVYGGGQLVGYVLDGADRPLANAGVSLAGDGTLSGTVYTDSEGRFETSVPVGQRTVQIALAALGVTALSSVDAPGSARSGPSEYVQPGDVVARDDDFVSVRWEQAGLARDLPVARSTAPGGETVSAYLVARDLEPGAARATLTDSTGAKTEANVEVFKVISATLERDRLRAGQSAGFEWYLQFGPGLAGKTVPVCAAAQGAVSVEGRRCKELEIGSDGSTKYAGKVRADRSFAGVFTLKPEVGRQRGGG